MDFLLDIIVIYFTYSIQCFTFKMPLKRDVVTVKENHCNYIRMGVVASAILSPLGVEKVVRVINSPQHGN